MTVYSMLSVILCLIVSIIGAWTDIKTGRVKNIYLIIAAGMGVLICVIAMVTQKVDFSILPHWVVNLLFSVLLSVIFYLFDVWAPGDAKLYILISALYPMDLYAAGPDNMFPALSIVVFAYAVGYIYLVFSTMSSSGSRRTILRFPTLNRSFSVGFLINAGIIVGFQIVIAILIPEFFVANQALVLMCIVGIGYVLQRKLPMMHSILGFSGFIATIVVMLITREYTTVLVSLPLSVIMALLMQWLTGMADSNSYREINGEDVQPGMILSFGSVLAMQKCIDPNIPRRTTENRRSRISTDQAMAVRGWCKKTNRSVIIVEMLPFAPFICIAIIIELVRHFAFY